MRIIFFISVMVLGFCNSLVAQYHDYTWVAGIGELDTTSVPGRYYGGSIIHFGGAKADLDFVDIGQEFQAQNSSMSFADGRLAYASNGCNIINSDFDIITNGDTINSEYVNRHGCFHPQGNFASVVFTGMTSIPHPEFDDHFYQVYFDLDNDPNSTYGIYSPHLFINEIVIDTSSPENDEVIRKKEIILDGRFATTSMSAVKDSVGNKWWIICRDISQSRFHKIHFYNLDSFEVTTQRIGIESDNTDGGSCLFTPDGKKLVISSYYNEIEVFDFNRATGRLSNPVYAGIYMDGPNPGISGVNCAISSNSRFLYAWEPSCMYQLDLFSDDLQASRVFIDSFDGFTDPFGVGFVVGQRAPDCKIYISGTSSTHYYHVIDHPNRKGTACGFRQHGFRLPAYNFSSIPLFPNYRLDTGPVCDSNMLVSVQAIPYMISDEVVVYPQPAQDEVHLRVGDVRVQPDKVEVYDVMGRQVLVDIWPAEIDLITLDLDREPSGIYFIKLFHRGRLIGENKLLIQK